jgi:hypothetical protein
MPSCNDDETIEHLLLEYSRTKEIWELMQDFGVTIQVETNSMLYGKIAGTLKEIYKDLFHFIICIVNAQIWKTQCQMTT